MRRRCLDWLSGLRADLWAPAAVRKGQQRAPQDPVDVSDALPQSTINRVSTLIREGALRRSCAALLQDPPVQPTDDVVASLRLLHPLPPDTDRADMSSLRRVAPQAAPVADSDQVRPFGLSLWARLSAVLQARLPWILSRSTRVSFWSLFSLGSRLRTAARRSFIQPASGSTATVPMRMKLLSLLTFPTLSIRSTGRLCCGLFVFISFRSLRGLTAVIVMIASSSLAPPWRLLRLFPAQGEFNRATLLARFSSRLPSTLSFWRPVLPRRPCTRVGSIFAPFTSLTGSVLVLPRRFGTFSLLWFMVSCVLGSRSTWTKPRLFLHVPPPISLRPSHGG